MKSAPKGYTTRYQLVMRIEKIAEKFWKEKPKRGSFMLFERKMDTKVLGTTTGTVYVMGSEEDCNEELKKYERAIELVRDIDYIDSVAYRRGKLKERSKGEWTGPKRTR